MKNILLNAALDYAARGWPIFPCEPRGKRPITSHGVKDATTDVSTIRQWWTRWPEANIALACGKISGISVVDIDVDEEKGINGWKSMEEFPDIPLTVQQTTPRGGAHMLFRTDNPPKNKNSFRPGIDIRADGYYIILTPSIHPNGKAYKWTDSCAPGEIDMDEYPDSMRPENERRRLPWEKPKPKPAPPPRNPPPASNAITERASRYLQECDPAIQGSAGHDSLLWAARALVVGFELDTGTALGLLWDEFNPRCVPPWNREDPRERKDFERKVDEVLKSPGQKPRGWLLDEYGLRENDDITLEEIGARSAELLLANFKDWKTPDEKPATDEENPAGEPAAIPGRALTEISDTDLAAYQKAIGKELDRRTVLSWKPFPVHCLPPTVAEYVRLAAGAHCVDLAMVGLPALVAGAAAIGNAVRLRLKDSFVVPATLWGAIIGKTGTNKTGPLKDVLSPLWRLPPSPKGNGVLSTEGALLNPIGRIIIEDATKEAITARLGDCPRGLLCFRDELAAWVKSFDAYRKQTGGDEQFWLKAWDAAPVQVDRKTDNEQCTIPAASVSVIGGIQPTVLGKCFTPDQHDSGFIPRLLVVNPPKQKIRWTEDVISPDAQAKWAQVLDTLRMTAFQELDAQNNRFIPAEISLSGEAKEIYVAFYNKISEDIDGATEQRRGFGSKSRVMTARLALILHSMKQASEGFTLNCPVDPDTMTAAVELGEWFLNEQIRVWGQAESTFTEKRADDIRAWLERRGGRTTVREYQISHTSRCRNRDEARADLDVLVQKGIGSWKGKEFILGKPAK